ncbi:tRNA-specific adenosine deaminase [Fibrobacterales bacterium]|nr:tRNA-specific adenosine deaminase [Fibrobacterales bacterium]
MSLIHSEKFMLMALNEAREAAQEGEVPVGAVVERNGEILGIGRNGIENQNSATAHAEILAINDAGKNLQNWRLNGATLFVTMEPCPMCWGAIINSRISKVVFAAKDTRANSGAAEATERAQNFVEIESGLLEKESAELLQNFFRSRRAETKEYGKSNPNKPQFSA